MIHYLLSFFEWIKVDFSGWLHPLKIKVRAESVLFIHYTVFFFVRKKLMDQLAVVSFSYHYLFYFFHFIVFYIDVVEGRIGEDWELVA